MGQNWFLGLWGKSRIGFWLFGLTRVDQKSTPCRNQLKAHWTLIKYTLDVNWALRPIAIKIWNLSRKGSLIKCSI